MIPCVLDSKIRDKKIPISVMLELTWHCNLKCFHCFQNAPENNELSTEELKRVLDEMAREKVFFLTFTGGEPLLRSDLFEIADYARKNNFVNTLYTNGTLITSSVAAEIAKAKFLYVQITLHGATAKTHDHVTGVKGSFDKTMAAIEMLKSRGVRVGLATTLMRCNFGELEAISRLHDKASDESRISPQVFPKNNGDMAPLRHNLDADQLREFFTFIQAKDSGIIRERQVITGLFCGMARTGCCINAVGEVYPCVALPIAGGDLRRSSFSHIWRDSDLFNKIHGFSVHDLRECSDCDLAGYCSRCSAMAYWENGDMLSYCGQDCLEAKILKEVCSDESGKEKARISEAEVFI